MIKDIRGNYTHLGTSVWVDPSALGEVALEIRKQNPSSFGPEKISSIKSRLQSFIIDYFPLSWFHLGIGRHQVDNYGDQITDEYISMVAPYFQRKFIDNNASFVLAVPIKSLGCNGIFESENIAISSPQELLSRETIFNIPIERLSPTRIPPSDFSSIRAMPITENDCWIITKGRTEDEAISLLNTALGAIWCVLYPRNHRFSGGEPFHGRLSWQNGASQTIFHGIDAPIRTPINTPILSQANLNLVGDILTRQNGFIELSRRRTTCEFLYHHWSQKGVIAFSNAVIAFDALFGAENDNMRRIGKAVAHILGDEIKAEKVTDIFKLRNSVLHGGNASVTQSSKYIKYYRKFKSEPESDVAQILNDCMLRVFRNDIFDFEYNKENPNLRRRIVIAFKYIFFPNNSD